MSGKYFQDNYLIFSTRKKKNGNINRIVYDYKLVLKFLEIAIDMIAGILEFTRDHHKKSFVFHSYHEARMGPEPHSEKEKLH